jgi:hypothetical protein
MKFYCLSLYILCIFRRHTLVFSLQTAEVSTYSIFRIISLTYVVPVAFSHAYRYLNTLAFSLQTAESRFLALTDYETCVLLKNSERNLPA